MSVNKAQDRIIGTHEGVMLIDAGAGTGKTHTITERYMAMLDKGVSPADILLVTFTDNAAANMRERALKRCIRSGVAPELMEGAHISTFHSFCSDVVREYGQDAGRCFGIDSIFPSDFSIVQEDENGADHFYEFFHDFRKARAEKWSGMLDFFGTNHGLLSKIIDRLASRAIVPLEEGWLGNGPEKIRGSFSEWRSFIDPLNVPAEKKGESLLSPLAKTFQNLLGSESYASPPVFEECLTAEGLSLSQDILEQAFSDPRDELIGFIHDLYRSYLEYSVRTGMVTFSFMVILAFMTLYSDDFVREKKRFKYIMVDEFQDTDSIEFMLILMLLREPNLCVVGDWKQGIYSFRNAVIQNILDFEKLLYSYTSELNKSAERVIPLPPAEKVLRIELAQNYRSSSSILDFSLNAFQAQGKQGEEITTQASDIVELEQVYDYGKYTDIGFFQASDFEHEAALVFCRIRELISSKYVCVLDFSWKGGNSVSRERPMEFRDICILSRNKDVCFVMQKEAEKYGIPARFEGQSKVWESREASVILAWFRLLDSRHDTRAWPFIMEILNRPFSFITEKDREYPDDILQKLTEWQDISVQDGLISLIMQFHGFKGPVPSVLEREIVSMYVSGLHTRSALLEKIGQKIDSCACAEIETGAGDNAVSIRTIHGVKGLEYPAVFLTNVRQSVFPNNTSDTDMLIYHDILGLRSRNEKGEKNGYTWKADSWKTDLVLKALGVEYDEERRLLYVAMTRAKQYLYFSNVSRPSGFYNSLLQSMSDGYEPVNKVPAELPALTVSVKKSLAEESIRIDPFPAPGRSFGVHSLMSYDPAEQGRGPEFGKKMHNFAARYALGNDTGDKGREFDRVRKYLEELKDSPAELQVEMDCVLPVGPHRIRGVIDLLAFKEDCIEIIDYKTDLTRKNADQYRIQLSCYYHVVKQLHPDKKIRSIIFWVLQDNIETINPLPIESIIELVNKHAG